MRATGFVTACLLLFCSACGIVDDRGDRGWRRRIWDASLPVEPPPMEELPPIDAGGITDTGTPPPPPPRDTGSGNGGGGIWDPMITGDPLAMPRRPCEPEPLPTTGNFNIDCVNRINQLRACQNLPPLQRWVEGESCAAMHAQSDQASRRAHGGFQSRSCTPSGYGQNECPGWGGWHGPNDVVEGCLQMMWDEWFTPGQKGHYENMSSRMYRRVACGIYEGTSVQNFSP